MTTTTATTVLDQTRDLAAKINLLHEARHRAQGYTHAADQVHVAERARGHKFHRIDVGTSGAWLVENATGEIFNIKAYGRPDHNKKAKANIGNVATVDPARVLDMRGNYLR